MNSSEFPDNCPKILVIDDEPAVRLSLTAYLEDMDYRVANCGSGSEALAMIRDFHFDIAIVDLRLPDVPGDLLISRMHEESPDTRFLIHTGSSSFTINSDLLSIGMAMSDVFLKPLADLAPLSNAIESLLRQIDANSV
ncbi:MAG: two-component system response regulator [Candidatus Wallbacteria bacterium HGW-Wallbacteria-1]|uniref:Two-component system response regulator n=1 Tax=Candidatus Wallbacteria bacterium HGW-Wallbacteria-1 TaxID=2013854 RepID=A0A2N1PPL5_9BACT|nr:MAG: two-component system response regulator [Candidatus Wallbacteria bacterium HGW-Wallbacteria-1]